MIVERPIYLNLAGFSEVKTAAQDVCERAPSWAGPIAGVIGGALVGALAGYFVPRVLDRVFEAPESQQVDLDIEP